MTPQDFINKWRDSSLKERAGSQEHFIDLCRMLGEKTPAEADSKGDWYTFEKGATKTGGGDGWADVWKRGCFAWEYKGKGKDLAAALKQLKLYQGALDNPPLLIVSDMEKIEIHTAWTNMVQEKHVFTFDDLIDGRRRAALKKAFSETAVEDLKPGKRRADLTADVAKEFVTLAQNLRARGHAADKVAHFVNRMVFCMFAEDVELLPDKLFKRMLEASLDDPEHFVDNAQKLFAAMAKPNGKLDFQRIEWFNGGLFDDDNALPLLRDDIKVALQAANQDWSNIDPSIMGTLFERGLDPDKRSQLGAHYTDPEKIMMIVNPVIIEPLTREWDGVRAEIETEIGKSRTAKSAGAKTQAFNRANEHKTKFLERLRNFRILDPACGSGNFLYLGLKALKDIEHRVNTECEVIGLQRTFPQVGPENMLGIEINPFAAELARVSVWIGEIQWMREHGFDASRNPILKSLDNIDCRDALLAKDGDEADWPEADVIIGNPPFVAARDMVPELGVAYAARVRKVFEPLIEGGVDFVCYWFVKASKQLEADQVERVGLVCTNSVPRSVSRKALDLIAQHSHIYSAVSNMLWYTASPQGGTGQFAAVRISIICLDRSVPLSRTLDGKRVKSITTDLYETSDDLSFDQTEIQKLAENERIAFQGIVPRSEVKRSDKLKFKLSDASFVLASEVGRSLLRARGNPNGRPNADVVKRYVVAEDITDRDEERFIVDFSGMSEQQSAQYQGPFAAIQGVKAHRARMSQAEALATWWQFWRSRVESRRLLSGLTRYIATPRSAKHRIFVFVDARMVPDNAVVWFATESMVTFGTLQSRIHEVWTLRRCSYQGVADTPRYKHTDVFEPYPFPTGLQPSLSGIDEDKNAATIAAAAKALNDQRDTWLNPADLVQRVSEVVPGYPDRVLPVDSDAAVILKTRTLTNLYNERPAWLDHAHRDLDKAVAAAYGWTDWGAGLPDDVILERLFKLNQERAAKQ